MPCSLMPMTCRWWRPCGNSAWMVCMGACWRVVAATALKCEGLYISAFVSRRWRTCDRSTVSMQDDHAQVKSPSGTLTLIAPGPLVRLEDGIIVTANIVCAALSCSRAMSLPAGNNGFRVHWVVLRSAIDHLSSVHDGLNLPMMARCSPTGVVGTGGVKRGLDEGDAEVCSVFKMSPSHANASYAVDDIHTHSCWGSGRHASLNCTGRRGDLQEGQGHLC